MSYYGKDHLHKPKKGNGSYSRNGKHKQLTSNQTPGQIYIGRKLNELMRSQPISNPTNTERG